MSKLLARLQTLQPALQHSPVSENGNWLWRDVLHSQPPEFFQPFIPHWRTLLLEYDVLKVQLVENLRKPHSESLLKRQLVAALMYSELLECIHRLINNPQEQAQLRVQQAVYHYYLRRLEMAFPVTSVDSTESVRYPFSDKIRQTTATTNWPRLLIVRLKRMLDAMVPILKNMHNFRRIVWLIDEIANPLFSWLAWLFYVPRLLINLGNTLKNTLQHAWMEKKKQPTLGWRSCLSLQWQKLWFEFCNDSLWLGVGLLNCFLLTGSLAPAAFYLTLLLYTFDIALAGIRAFIEYQRFTEVSQSYLKMMQQSKDDDDATELRVYQGYCSSQERYEKARLWLNIGTCLALFIGMTFSIPAFSISPVLPFLGALFIVATCIISFYLGQKIEQLKPDNRLPNFKELPELSFFHDNRTPAAHPGLHRAESVNVLSKVRKAHYSSPSWTPPHSPAPPSRQTLPSTTLLLPS
ncbi:MAG: hypothetical protein JJT82_02080 [Legionellaceae bacterium]|nr:hypothetical protein [Legionellaceae bacterium]